MPSKKSLAPFGNLALGNVRYLVEKKQKEIVQKKLAIFPNIRDEELKTMHYLEPNVMGELPKS
jgi:hypothetical protein